MKFRGTTPEGKEVEGWFCIWQGIVYIFDSPYNLYHGRREVLPSSLAMYTGIDDKNGVPIYGSFVVDGVMSEGGDRVRGLIDDEEHEWDVEWFRGNEEWTGWELGSYDDSLEVIPKEKGAKTSDG